MFDVIAQCGFCKNVKPLVDAYVCKSCDREYWEKNKK